ncbi:enoyl-CoA hydratase-related protein [Bradyrhizobium sp. 14AA]
MHSPNAHSPVEYQSILVERRANAGLIILNRPKQFNALNRALSLEVLRATQSFDADPEVGAIVVAGSQKAFAAGADIKEMQSKSFADLFNDDCFGAWDQLTTIRKPLIAAVSGLALGGGCELAMICDFIIAGESAKFGQPEIKLGVLPGIGGSQRLTRLVGRSLAMDMILTGRLISAAEARSAGLVARVVPDLDLLATALDAAAIIAGYSLPAVMMAKEAVNRAEETALAEGLRHERRLFQAAFATQGQKEGMSAFLEKRTPSFSGR